MRLRLCCTGCAATVALGIFSFGAAAVAGASTVTGVTVPATTTTSTASNTILAPLWVYPTGESAPPVMVAPSAPGGPSVLVIRDEPSLLRPADMHFSTDQENGVTVVRGPLAR
jgi:hypothetical protein